MDQNNWEKLGVYAGAIILFLGSFASVIRGHMKGDGVKRPDAGDVAVEKKERAKMLEKLDQIFRLLARHSASSADNYEKVSERLGELERNSDKNSDRLDMVLRSSERIEAAQRFGYPAQHLYRNHKETDK